MKRNIFKKSKNSIFFEGLVNGLFFAKKHTCDVDLLRPFFSENDLNLKDKVKLLKDQRCLGYINLILEKNTQGYLEIKKHREQGNLKARLIKSYTQNDELIIINTAGGLTSGDLNFNSIKISNDVSIIITTQSMEKIYKCKNLHSHSYTNIEVGVNSSVSWMPLETIFFNGGKYRRRINIDLKYGSNFLGIETIIFGRKAMGEIVNKGELDDGWQIHKNGQLLYSDFNRITGNINKKISKPFISKGNNIFCNIVYTGKKIRLYEKKILLHFNKLNYFLGVSVVNGVLLLKMLSKDITEIRSFLDDLIKIFDENFNLPRIWSF
tara:strand:- start:997 stop:1962 length:966 start_codon:yes stop_codon:yes gene_type:complete